MSAFWSVLFGILLFSIALFLILLILVQRGRGGGLSGALGGMGGQSAFGTKAGDLFTRVTIVSATAWIVLCLLAILVMNPQSRGARSGGSAGGEGTEFIPRSSDAADIQVPETPAPASAPAPAPNTPAPAETPQ